MIRRSDIRASSPAARVYGVILGVAGSSIERVKNKASGSTSTCGHGVLLLISAFFVVWRSRGLLDELDEAEAEGSAAAGADRTTEREPRRRATESR
jgi:hypothetical protein